MARTWVWERVVFAAALTVMSVTTITIADGSAAAIAAWSDVEVASTAVFQHRPVLAADEAVRYSNDFVGDRNDGGGGDYEYPARPAGKPEGLDAQHWSAAVADARSRPDATPPSDSAAVAESLGARGPAAGSGYGPASEGAEVDVTVPLSGGGVAFVEGREIRGQEATPASGVPLAEVLRERRQRPRHRQDARFEQEELGEIENTKQSRQF